jgi:hypothetical protein
MSSAVEVNVLHPAAPSRHVRPATTTAFRDFNRCIFTLPSLVVCHRALHFSITKIQDVETGYLLDGRFSPGTSRMESNSSMGAYRNIF